jgi:hypothetical protein
MVSEDRVRIRSYLLWENAGRPHGRDLEFWLCAEAELLANSFCAVTPGAKSGRAVFVPRVPVSAPLRRTISRRVPPREHPSVAIAARQ